MAFPFDCQQDVITQKSQVRVASTTGCYHSKVASQDSVHLCCRDVSDGLKQAAVVKPVDPFGRFPFDCSFGFLGSGPINILDVVRP
jgi:hypothetical protein